MEREELNIYIDGLLSLSEAPDEARSQLIELAFFHDDWPTFLAEWLWLNHKAIDVAWKLKSWFAWSYSELAEVFALDFREFGRTLRSQRLERLGPYPSASQDELPHYGGLSCFMVEQQLSNWIDSEWEDTTGLHPIHRHLSECTPCKERLYAYRKLQAEVLTERAKFEPITAEEWLKAYRRVQKKKWQARRQWTVVMLLALAFLAIILWMLQSQPEKMPNIYEIKEF